MNEKILFVDDEAAVLAGYQRILHGAFEVNTAGSGEDAIAQISNAGPYAVIVSDMRMPGMDGVELLCRVRDLSPQTVRVVLTGYADIDSAINAVNEDEIFRFLTKPCDAAVLKKTLTSCLLQYQLVSAEKELLENTLKGSIKVLTDVLSLANPAAFGRSLRINRSVQHMVRELHLDAPWKYEVAAMLSQVGCITLDPEVLEAAYSGGDLSTEERVHFNMHPAVARDLLANIPRLEGVAWIVGQQFGAAYADRDISDSIRTGAAILRVAIAYDELKMRGRSEVEALAELRASGKFDLRIVQVLETLRPVTFDMERMLVPTISLSPGMILDEEVKSKNGLLLASKGQEVSEPLVVRLRNFHRSRSIADKIAVLTSKTTSDLRLAAGMS